MRSFLYFAVFLCIAAPARAGQDAPPVVVELFTSQNCSACPAADELLADIAHNPDSGLIVLGCHVTHWDHLRWKDTLSLPECDDRQKDFAGLLEQGRSYTPNMVVNGRSSFVGSRGFDLDLAVRKARQRDEVLPIQIGMTEKRL